MTEDNRDQYGRKDEKLKIYRIPLNFKIDASVLGFTIEWKRLFESLAVGAICFLTALMIGGMFSLDAKVMLGIEALGFIGGTAASMVGINGVSLLDYLLRIFHFMKERKVYGPPDEAYRERYELELDKERVKNQKNINTKFDDANSKSSKKKRERDLSVNGCICFLKLIASLSFVIVCNLDTCRFLTQFELFCFCIIHVVACRCFGFPDRVFPVWKITLCSSITACSSC